MFHDIRLGHDMQEMSIRKMTSNSQETVLSRWNIHVMESNDIGIGTSATIIRLCDSRQVMSPHPQNEVLD